MFIYDTLGEHNDSGIIFRDYESLERFWLEHSEVFRIVYQPLQPQEEFDYIAHLVYNVGDCVFLVEELDTFCSPYSFSLDFANIIQRGRHVGIDFMGISQRPFGINRTISAQCNEIITFKQSEPRDITFLSQYLGEDVELVRNLDLYHYLRWANNTITIHTPQGAITTYNREGSKTKDQETPEISEEMDPEHEERPEKEFQEKDLTEDENILNI